MSKKEITRSYDNKPTTKKESDHEQSIMNEIKTIHNKEREQMKK
jgi:hypothetical protein